MSSEETQKVRGHDFTVGPRYKVLEFIGEGAYGIVVKATDTQGDPSDNGGNGTYWHVFYSMIMIDVLTHSRHQED